MTAGDTPKCPGPEVINDFNGVADFPRAGVKAETGTEREGAADVGREDAGSLRGGRGPRSGGEGGGGLGIQEAVAAGRPAAARAPPPRCGLESQAPQEMRDRVGVARHAPMRAGRVDDQPGGDTCGGKVGREDAVEEAAGLDHLAGARLLGLLPGERDPERAQAARVERDHGPCAGEGPAVAGGEPLGLLLLTHVAGQGSATGLARWDDDGNLQSGEHAEHGPQRLGTEDAGVATEEERDVARGGGAERNAGRRAPRPGAWVGNEGGERTQGGGEKWGRGAKAQSGPRPEHAPEERKSLRSAGQAAQNAVEGGRGSPLCPFGGAKPVEQRSVGHLGRADRLAEPTTEATVEMPPELVVRFEDAP